MASDQNIDGPSAQEKAESFLPVPAAAAATSAAGATSAAASRANAKRQKPRKKQPGHRHKNPK